MQRWQCADPDFDGTASRVDPARTLATIRNELESPDSTYGRRIQALAELRWRGSRPEPVERARLSLERALNSSPRDPTVLNDLAVIYYELAQQEQSLLPLLRALQLLDDGVSVAPQRKELLFNRALVLQGMYFLGSAESAWAEYLARETDPNWRNEATAHLRRLRLDADTSSVGSAAQAARERLLRELSTWADAVARRDMSRVRSVIAAVRDLADSVRAFGGDQSIVRVVDWLSATTDGSTAMSRQAASGASDLVRGIAQHDSARYEQAEVLLERANASLSVLKSPLTAWSESALAAADLNLAKYPQAVSHVEWILQNVDSSQSELIARAWWLRGVIALREGNYETANNSYVMARSYFVRAKDVKNEAAVAYLLTEGLELAGQTNASLREALIGLRGLAPFPDLMHRTNHLMRVAAIARGQQWRNAALDAVDEALRVDLARTKPDAYVLALTVRAQDLAAVDRFEDALDALRQARAVADRLAGRSKAIAVASIDLMEGRILRTGNPQAGLAQLEQATAAYRRLDVSAYLSASLYELARASYDAGDPRTARSTTIEALNVVAKQRAHFTSVDGRAAYLETTENVFDLLIDLDIDDHRYTEAFDDLERERQAIWSPSLRLESSMPRGANRIEQLTKSLDSRSILIAYGVLQRRLVIWYASRAGFGTRVVPIARSNVDRLTRLLADELSSPSAGQAMKAAAFDLLLRPINDRLERVDRVIVIPDRELLNVPFSALWDSTRSRYAIENFSIRTLSSASFVDTDRARAAPTGSLKSSSIVAVGNPLLGDAVEPSLPPLRGAEGEARAVAAKYGRSRLLVGSGATRSALIDGMEHADVVHFAGHAVFNADQPERSYLALAADFDGTYSRLEAREIASLRLSNVKVIVLSACNTLGSQPSRTGTVVGLAASFLRAGARSAVSTLWSVDDDAVQPLILKFHELAAGGADLDEALRQAQLEAMKSKQAGVSSPKVWAAFVYTGD